MRHPTGADEIPARRAFIERQREAPRPAPNGASRMPQVPMSTEAFGTGVRG